MANIFRITYQSLPGMKRYSHIDCASSEEAVSAFRKMMAEKLNFDEYLNHLKTWRYADMTKSFAEVFEKIIKDPKFPQSKNDLRFDSDPTLYIKEKCNNDEIEFSEKFDFCIDEKGIIMRDGETSFSAIITLPLLPGEALECIPLENPDNAYPNAMIGFYEENRFRGTNDFSAGIEKITYYSPGTYPVLILTVLQESRLPLCQNDIADLVCEKYCVRPDRKTIGRNIALLKDIGIDIRNSSKGYYIPGLLSNEDKADIEAAVSAFAYADKKRNADLVKKIAGI